MIPEPIASTKTEDQLQEVGHPAAKVASKQRVAQTAVQAAFVGIFGVLVAVLGPIGLVRLYSSFPGLSDSKSFIYLSVFPLFILGTILGFFIYAQVLNAKSRWLQMDFGDKVTVFVGIFAGIIASFPIFNFLQAFHSPAVYEVPIIFGVTIFLASLCIYGLRTMSDILPWYQNRVASRRSGIKILDTNVIIDGRIYDIMKSGFLEGDIYVSKFVLEELQHIADSHDALKRARGRRGLEILKHMQAEFQLTTGNYDKYATDPNEEVDSRLIRIARAIGADIVTNDWNMNSVAKLQNVRILSLNELALTLRPNVLPSEHLELSILREGSQYGQGVGYLEDGTMVVVENGRGYIGQTELVTVTQVIQTERGKMIFGRVESQDQHR